MVGGGSAPSQLSFPPVFVPGICVYLPLNSFYASRGFDHQPELSRHPTSERWFQCLLCE
jgi:hypothetical protein